MAKNMETTIVGLYKDIGFRNGKENCNCCNGVI